MTELLIKATNFLIKVTSLIAEDLFWLRDYIRATDDFVFYRSLCAMLLFSTVLCLFKALFSWAKGYTLVKFHGYLRKVEVDNSYRFIPKFAAGINTALEGSREYCEGFDAGYDEGYKKYLEEHKSTVMKLWDGACQLGVDVLSWFGGEK